MKLTAYINLLLVACSTLSCNKPTTTNEPHIHTIASLREIETNNRSIKIQDNITIEGTITANDQYGELSNCLIIQDTTAALKLLCEGDNLYQTYPIASQIRLSCNGLYLNNQYGGIKIGAEPTDLYTLDYIQPSKLGTYLKHAETPPSEPLATPVAIPSLTPLDTYALIKLSEVQIIPDTITTFCGQDPTTGRTLDTTHTLADREGNLLTLAVRSSCQYAHATLPTKECTLQGIVDHFDEHYTITICNAAYEEK